MKLSPAARGTRRTADRVFAKLLRSIMAGELRAGQVVPGQRELAMQFHVSTMSVRYAIHRLEGLGLVRVRQGRPTVVSDQSIAKDLRLQEFELRAATHGDALALYFLEYVEAFCLPMLILAQRRRSSSDIQGLEHLLQSFDDQKSGSARMRWHMDYMEAIAGMAQNPYIRDHVRWLLRLEADLLQSGRLERRSSGREMYSAVNRSLSQGAGAAEIWLQRVRDVCAWTEAQPNGVVPSDSRRRRQWAALIADHASDDSRGG